MSTDHANPAFTWDGLDVTELLRLEKLSPGRFRNRLHDDNPNGRAFGGQIVGQALSAALQTVDGVRAPTVLQLLFLQGAHADEPVEFDVTALQDGKRFSSRHVRGSQGGRFICDAHMSFQQEPAGLELAERLIDPVPEPESLPTLVELAATHATRFAERGWRVYGKPCLDMCLVDSEEHLFETGTRPHMKFWMKLKGPARQSPSDHYAALAYISDYYIATSSLTPHRALTSNEDKLYVSSLNHGIWFHGPCPTDDWLLFVSDNVRTTQGRGLVVVKVYDRGRHHVATITQECLITAA